MKKIKKINGFTLTEIMVVVLLIGIIAAFGLPSYSKAVTKAHVRDAVIQLTALHGANRIYQAQTGDYLDDGGAPLDVIGINTGLNINLVETDLFYEYTYVPGASPPSTSTFIATAEWPIATSDYVVQLTEGPIVKDTNPCCDTDNCPGLGNCP